MVSMDALKEVGTIVVHDFCADGLASALLLHDALPQATVEFVQYGTPAHQQMEARPGMLFCDFSPVPERADEFAQVGAVVLDHHRTAQRTVEVMGHRGVFGDERAEPGVCGAVLAYRHVWRPLRGAAALHPFAERLAALAGVRDTWQTHDPRWRAACAQAELLGFLPKKTWLAQSLADIARTWDADVARFGEALLDKQADRVARAIRDAHRFHTKDGQRVVAFEGTSLSSDAAEMLALGADVVIGFGFSVEGAVPKMRFSMRSHTGFDCAAFAKARGGGGHTAAAGFSMPLTHLDPNPYALVEGLFA